MERIIVAMLLIGAANGFWLWVKSGFELVYKIFGKEDGE